MQGMDIMVVLWNVLLVLHFIGLASLVGGVMVQLKSIGSGAKVNPAMMHGALTQLVTGLLLVLIAEFGDGTVNHLKIGIKLLVVIIITVLVFVFRKKDKPATWVVPAIGLLALLNVIIAVFV